MKKYFIYGIAILLLIGSCKKVDHSTLFTAQEFPTTIGSWWMYQDIDESGVIHDTFTYTILDTQILYAVSFQRWVVSQFGSNPAHNDTMYVFVTDTAVGFYSQNGLYYPTPASFNIKFPVIDNETWCAPQQGYSYSTGIQNVNVNGFSYNSVVYLNASSYAGQGLTNSNSYWIMKNVGIVEELINDPQSNYSHEILIAYHIN